MRLIDADALIAYCNDNWIPLNVDAVNAQSTIQPELTDEQSIAHLQSSGWMQRHDKEMYESGLKEQLADDSDSYDSLLSSVQPDHVADISKKVSISCVQENDLISRQVTINVVGDWIYNPEDLRYHKDVINSIPAVQPEIVRCKDCKFSHMTNDGRYCKYCDQFTDDYGELVEMYFDSNFYCGYAERRTE